MPDIIYTYCKSYEQESAPETNQDLMTDFKRWIANFCVQAAKYNPQEEECSG